MYLDDIWQVHVGSNKKPFLLGVQTLSGNMQSLIYDLPNGSINQQFRLLQN